MDDPVCTMLVAIITSSVSNANMAPFALLIAATLSAIVAKSRAECGGEMPEGSRPGWQFNRIIWTKNRPQNQQKFNLQRIDRVVHKK